MKKGIYKELLIKAVPAMLESLFVVLIIMLDTWMVSPCGTTAIAAVAVANQPKLFLFLIFIALGTATTIVVAQAYGREDRVQANSIVFFSVKAAALISVIMAAVVIAAAHPIIFVISGQKDTMDMSVAFLRIIMVGMVFQAVSTAMNAALRGIGRMQATLLSNVMVGLVDLLFNYLLIEGHCGFPAWGVVGAAVATALGCVAGFIVSLCYMIRPNCFLNLRFCLKNHLRVNKQDATDMHKKLLNVYSENILTRVGFLVSGIIVARLGSYNTSIYSVGLQLLNLSFVFGDGIQSAMISLIGRCMGANDQKSCISYVHGGVRMGIFISILVALLCLFIGEPFFGLFSSEAEFIDTGIMISRFVAVIVPFQILRIIRLSILRGLGDTKNPAIIGSISALVIDPPMSFLFAVLCGKGQIGLWIGTVISQIAWFIMAEVVSRKSLKQFHKEGTI